VHTDLRTDLRRMLKRSDKPHEELAQQLSARVRFRVSVRMLNDWTAPSRHKRFPLELLAPLCEILDDNALALAAIPDSLRKLVKVGEAVLDASERSKKG
jgi:hypothetical protein